LPKAINFGIILAEKVFMKRYFNKKIERREAIYEQKD